MRNTSKIIDITGNKYNKLTVLGIAKRNPIYWKCVCECGNITNVSTNNLKTGKVKSCGCLQRRGNPTHGKSNTRLYRIYKKIIRRCSVKEDPAFRSYGGRGITVCDEWANSFESFYNWAINNGYAENLSIDRIDNEKGYSPKNCRWASPKEQSNNRRSNRKFTLNGVTKDLAQWCSEYGVSYEKVWARLKRGWEIEEALEHRQDARIVRRKEIAK